MDFLLCRIGSFKENWREAKLFVLALLFEEDNAEARMIFFFFFVIVVGRFGSCFFLKKIGQRESLLVKDFALAHREFFFCLLFLLMKLRSVFFFRV